MDSFCGGAAAGLAVDMSLYPLDTIKTRLQSKAGFWNSGGFTGVYKGIGAVTIGSVPGGALFFVAYDEGKRVLPATAPGQLAASTVAECTACVVRVPTEMVKQQMQVGRQASVIATLRSIIARGGPRLLYGGYGATVAREVPFAAIQMPLYEQLKHNSPWKCPAAFAVCGSVAGGVAAAVTTPLDVAKTRIMLGESKSRSFPATIAAVARDEGVAALWKGVGPRVMWITIGGALFFGTYETVKSAAGTVVGQNANAVPHVF